MIGPLALNTAKLFRRSRSKDSFKSSANYWDKRYDLGGTSGRGSYGELAKFKAEVLNAFVEKNRIQSVIEFGSGDGNQLLLSQYPSYTGFDVSPAAVAVCQRLFEADKSKHFSLVKDYAGEKADLSLSLDVIYHLVEDEVFNDYIRRLFQAAKRFVVIYSSDHEELPALDAPHVRHRRFSNWIAKNQSEWRLIEHVKNPYPWDAKLETGSFADFYFYRNDTGGHFENEATETVPSNIDH